MAIELSGRCHKKEFAATSISCGFLSAIMISKSWLPLLTLLCFTSCIYAQNFTNRTCDNDVCPASQDDTDDEGNIRDQCCQHIVFVDGCCSKEQNNYLRLIRDVIIGVSVGVAGLIAILVLICVCCCCCVCCG